VKIVDMISPEYMGYDRTIAVFSPDGRLFQVEYTKESVKRGTTCIGIVFKDGVVLATVKSRSKLIVPTSAEKVFQIDDHISAVAAGLLADARILVNQSRVRAQVHKITYNEPIDVWGVARVIGDRMQLSTLYAGLRPYGVAFLVGGVDGNEEKSPHVIEADPSGMLYEWQARAIGKGAAIANKIFSQRWKPGMDEQSAVDLAKEIMDKTEKGSETVLDIVVIKKDEKPGKLNETGAKKGK